MKHESLGEKFKCLTFKHMANHWVKIIVMISFEKLQQLMDTDFPIPVTDKHLSWSLDAFRAMSHLDILLLCILYFLGAF